MVGPLRVWEWAGEPPGALLLHGIANYGRYWDFVADAIAGRLALVAPALAYLRETSPGYSEEVYANRMAWVFARDGRGLVWRSSKDALTKILDQPNTGVWERVGEIACPVLVVRGTRSPSLSADVARRLVADLRHARLLELDAGHNVALDRPRELAEAMLSFAREVS